MGVPACQKCARAIPAQRRLDEKWGIVARDGRAHLTQNRGETLACDGVETEAEKIARLEAEVAELKTYKTALVESRPHHEKLLDDLVTAEAKVSALTDEVAELKERLGGRERECDDYDKVLGNYMRAGEEADAKIEQLKAEVAEFAADVERWRSGFDADHSSERSMGRCDGLMEAYRFVTRRLRERGLLED